MLDVAIRHAFPGFALDVAFTAPAVGVTALFGPSGCGKSTILAAIAGLLRPDAGRIALGGTPLFDAGARHMLPAERRRCGMVFQEARLFPHLSVESNLRYGLRRAPRGAAGPGLEEVVDLLGIAALLARRPAALSGGEKQRVALGRALLSRPAMLLMDEPRGPAMLLMDEPLAALDAPRKAEVLPYLARLRQTLAIPLLYVTHALEEVDQLADTLVLLAAGRVLASGTVEDLAALTDLPMLAGRRDAGALLACTVLEHDAARQLTRLGFPGGTLAVPLAATPVGSTQRLRLRARDVAVATEEPRGLSVQNVLPVVLEALEPGAAGEAMLRLRAGPSLLLARVTLDSAQRLALRPGQPLWALVKSVALAPRGPGA